MFPAPKTLGTRADLAPQSPALATVCEALESTDHSLSIDDWAYLLALAFPDDYNPPPQPSAPAAAMTQEARVEIYRRRAERGQLFHADDLWRQDLDLKVGVLAEHAANGADTIRLDRHTSARRRIVTEAERRERRAA